MTVGTWKAWWGATALPMLATCASPPVEAPAEAFPARQKWVEQVDFAKLRDEAAGALSGYLAVDTTNPPGRETEGAAYLGRILAAEGIAFETWEFAPGRSNLVARLRAERPVEKPLCLLSHLDVVTAERDRWSHDPFSGEIDADGWIWGRGALDMKGLGIAELMSLVQLKRLGVPLRRDVILLAVGDEEVDNLGVKDLAANHWDELGCSHVINEGGLGVHGALDPDLTTFTVSFTEKGAFWLRMVAEGVPGHGSTPLPDAAPARLMQALERLRARKDQAIYHPEMFHLLAAVGERMGGLQGAVLRSPGLTKALATGQLLENPLSRAVLTNTINVTGFGGAEEPNVVPGKVWAQLDVRMLPGVRGAQMLDELKALVAGVEGISFEVISETPAFESPTDDPLYRTIVRRLQTAWPDAAVGPFIMMGTTDSQVLREKGVRCYGVAPFVASEQDLRGMHGDDERIHRDVLGRGVQVLLQIVLDAAAEG